MSEFALRSQQMERAEARKVKPEERFTITELAEEMGLTTRALRFYEDKGLISPERQGQTRIYHPRDRARVILIVRGRNVGLQLSEIREILDLYELHDGCETQNRVAVAKFQQRIDRLEHQRSDIENQIAALKAGKERLEATLPKRKSAKAKATGKAKARATAMAAE